jgi:hypothetical protein
VPRDAFGLNPAQFSTASFMPEFNFVYTSNLRVMLAYNLMNLFKELVLEQRDKKRMGKLIRQSFIVDRKKPYIGAEEGLYPEASRGLGIQ